MTTAAFFRVEGTLLSRGVLSASAYFAANGQGMRERIFRLGQVALAAPVYGLLGQNDRETANRVAYLALRNMSEDRLAVLAEEYVDTIVSGQILQNGVDLVRKARKDGHRVVLISESIDPVIRPALDTIRGWDDLICNQLELRDGRCTGRLLDPVVGGHDGGRWAQKYAAEHGIDLANSVAYAGHGPDALLLAAVGQPCAVNPDFTLRRAAQGADWPVLDYSV